MLKLPYKKAHILKTLQTPAKKLLLNGKEVCLIPNIGD